MAQWRSSPSIRAGVQLPSAAEWSVRGRSRSSSFSATPTQYGAALHGRKSVITSPPALARGAMVVACHRGTGGCATPKCAGPAPPGDEAVGPHNVDDGPIIERFTGRRGPKTRLREGGDASCGRSFTRSSKVVRDVTRYPSLQHAIGPRRCRLRPPDRGKPPSSRPKCLMTRAFRRRAAAGRRSNAVNALRLFFIRGKTRLRLGKTRLRLVGDDVEVIARPLEVIGLDWGATRPGRRSFLATCNWPRRCGLRAPDCGKPRSRRPKCLMTRAFRRRAAAGRRSNAVAGRQLIVDTVTGR